MELQTYSLLQVTKSIRKTISDRYQSSFWVRAEMNKLNFYKHSGHCYPELVEKENGKVIAQLNGVLWNSAFINANNKFLSVLKEPLKDGIKILFLAKIIFDPAHGLALQILDIDPAYTMGDLEKEKKDTIDRLKREGIYDKNRSLKFPLLPQRIAIISVETSKGYADFLSVIGNNQWNYKFFHHLFPSLLQGEKAVDGIIGQLHQIRKVLKHFDVVAIIRGGGGDVGLSCYNSYKLAKEIATFPLPVVTGIGHATNETVAEMISHLNAITPTKLAVYLMQHFNDFARPVQRGEELIVMKAQRILAENRNLLGQEVKIFKSVTGNIIIRNKNSVANLSGGLIQKSQGRFTFENERIVRLKETMAGRSSTLIKGHDIDIARFTISMTKDFRTIISNLNQKLINAERNIANMSPQNVLKRGYSITLHNGHAITDGKIIKPGDTLKTILYQGTVISTAEIINTNE